MVCGEDVLVGILTVCFEIQKLPLAGDAEELIEDKAFVEVVEAGTMNGVLAADLG